MLHNQTGSTLATEWLFSCWKHNCKNCKDEVCVACFRYRWEVQEVQFEIIDPLAHLLRCHRFFVIQQQVMISVWSDVFKLLEKQCGTNHWHCQWLVPQITYITVNYTLRRCEQDFDVTVQVALASPVSVSVCVRLWGSHLNHVWSLLCSVRPCLPASRYQVKTGRKKQEQQEVS